MRTSSVWRPSEIFRGFFHLRSQFVTILHFYESLLFLLLSEVVIPDPCFLLSSLLDTVLYKLYVQKLHIHFSCRYLSCLLNFLFVSVHTILNLSDVFSVCCLILEILRPKYENVIYDPYSAI
jgi:hypothetical protein